MGDDSELVERLRCGDVNAFEELYHKYKQRIYQTALAICGDSAAAEEILQDCFVRAYRARERIRDGVPLMPWLYRIAVNLSYNWASRGRPWTIQLDCLNELGLSSSLPSPEHLAEDSELSQTVRDAVARLPVKHRAVVVLFYFEGLSLLEISWVSDCPLGTVKSRLHRACEMLRQDLGRDARLVEEVTCATV